jgi:hypothetical protein
MPFCPVNQMRPLPSKAGVEISVGHALGRQRPYLDVLGAFDWSELTQTLSN